MGHVSPKKSTEFGRSEAPGQESSQTNFTSDAYQHYDNANSKRQGEHKFP
jgi:hypothetical protein